MIELFCDVLVPAMMIGGTLIAAIVFASLIGDDDELV
jgi:hypothetical protein